MLLLRLCTCSDSCVCVSVCLCVCVSVCVCAGGQPEVVQKLDKSGIRPGITLTVWKKLEEHNPDFFATYRVRLQLLAQIQEFNKIVRRCGGLNACLASVLTRAVWCVGAGGATSQGRGRWHPTRRRRCRCDGRRNTHARAAVHTRRLRGQRSVGCSGARVVGVYCNSLAARQRRTKCDRCRSSGCSCGLCVEQRCSSADASGSGVDADVFAGPPGGGFPWWPTAPYPATAATAAAKHAAVQQQQHRLGRQHGDRAPYAGIPATASEARSRRCCRAHWHHSRRRCGWRRRR